MKGMEGVHELCTCTFTLTSYMHMYMYSYNVHRTFTCTRTLYIVSIHVSRSRALYWRNRPTSICKAIGTYVYMHNCVGLYTVFACTCTLYTYMYKTVGTCAAVHVHMFIHVPVL